jgi:hypothetical protein
VKERAVTTRDPFDDTDRVLDRIVDRFDERYEGAVDRETIDREVHEIYTELATDAKVDSLLPALTEHEVGDRLAEEVGRPPALVEDVSDQRAPDIDLRAGAGRPQADPGGLGRPVSS